MSCRSRAYGCVLLRIGHCRALCLPADDSSPPIQGSTNIVYTALFLCPDDEWTGPCVSKASTLLTPDQTSVLDSGTFHFSEHR